MKSLASILAASLFSVSTAFAIDLTTPSTFGARVGVGSSLSPEKFLLVVGAEYFPDRFVSIGPLFQMGMGNDSQLFIPTVGARFHLPVHAFERLELSLQSGVGGVVRQESGFTFRNFAYEVGLNADWFITQGIAVGLGGILNVTSNRTERTVGALFVEGAYRF